MKLQKNIPLVLFVFAVNSLVMGCGGKEEPSTQGAESEGKKETTTSEATSPVDMATAATINGKVLFEGTTPRMKKIDMAAEVTCQQMYPEGPRTENVLVNENGTLRNVFVYVKEGLGDMEFPTPKESVLLDQKGCRYYPHVIGIQAGQPLKIRNSDPVAHNIHPKPKNSKSFNISQPVQGMETTKKFSKPEIMVPIACDIHSWMSAYVAVLDHPYHSTTGTEGTFELKSLPPGEYAIEAWHEEYGSQTQTIQVGEGETKEINFTFKPET